MLGRWLRPAYCASTSVTFEPARHTASILFGPLGCWGCHRMGAKSGGEKLRKSEWPARILCSTGNSPLHFLNTGTFASSSIYRVLSVMGLAIPSDYNSYFRWLVYGDLTGDD